MNLSSRGRGDKFLRKAISNTFTPVLSSESTHFLAARTTLQIIVACLSKSISSLNLRLAIFHGLDDAVLQLLFEGNVNPAFAAKIIQ